MRRERQSIYIRKIFAVLLVVITASLFMLINHFTFRHEALATNQNLVPVVPERPYAQITTNNTMLYHRNGEFFTPITSLPRTYFVHIQAETETHFEVVFLDLTGFVLREMVEVVDFEPVTKFATGTLSITSAGNAIIFARPDANSNELFNATRGLQLVFYGTIDGTAPTITSSTSWYFVRFSEDINTAAFGYVHSSFVSPIAPIPDNIVERVMKNAPSNPELTPPTIPLPSSTITLVMIIVLSVLAVVITILIFKRPKKKKPANTTS